MAYVEKYNSCLARLAAKGEGHCEGYAFDLWHCIDHCAQSEIFKNLK